MLPPLRHDMAVSAILCAKNAWLNRDTLKPLWCEMNEPWNIVFVYAEDDSAMTMALYVPVDPLRPSDNAASRIVVDHRVAETLHVSDTNYAERFATECVTTMEYGVRTTVGEVGIYKLTRDESRKNWPRVDPPL